MKSTQGTRRIALAVNRERMQTWFVALTFFHSAATCLHVPARLTLESTKHEGRKPRTSERHVVGCCEQLGGVNSRSKCNAPRRKRGRSGTLTNLSAKKGSSCCTITRSPLRSGIRSPRCGNKCQGSRTRRSPG